MWTKCCESLPKLVGYDEDDKEDFSDQLIFYVQHNDERFKLCGDLRKTIDGSLYFKDSSFYWSVNFVTHWAPMPPDPLPDAPSIDA